MRYHLYYVIKWKEGHPGDIISGPHFNKKKAKEHLKWFTENLPIDEYTLVEQTIGAELV